MKPLNSTLRNFRALLWFFIATMAFVACSKDPDNPNDEILTKEHGDPVKAVLVLTKGHLHGTYDFHAEADSQVITFTTTASSGWAAQDLSSFSVEAGVPDGETDSVAYALHIYYYNANGALINNEFVTNGQDLIHQHFFVASDVTPNNEAYTYLYNDNTKLLYDYAYADTDPSDSTKIIGGTNPIGFKGFFKFKAPEKQFKMSIRLMHARTSKYENGTASPFYKPSARQRQSDHWDLQIDVPITIEGADEHEEESEAAKAVLTLVEGHLHGTYGFHQNPDLDSMKYLKKIQTITLTNSSGSWAIADGSQTQFNVRSGIPGTKPENGNAVYGLWIRYYNENDSLINGSFIENGNDLLHQHFFIPQNVSATFDGTAETDDSNTATLYDYVYVDTDPWNKTVHYDGATITGKTNPIGFKGYFRFNKARKQFTMSIRLMHSHTSKFENGIASPFYAPTAAQLQTNHWDVIMNVPFVVYASQEEYLDYEEQTADWDELSTDDQKYLSSIASAYGITWQQALLDLYWLMNSTVSAESGTVWF